MSNRQESLSTSGSTPQESKSPFPFGQWVAVRSEVRADDAMLELCSNGEFVESVKDLKHRADVDDLAKKLGIDSRLVEIAWHSWRLWLQSAKGS
jgi:hypothetical protein